MKFYISTPICWKTQKLAIEFEMEFAVAKQWTPMVVYFYI